MKQKSAFSGKVLWLGMNVRMLQCSLLDMPDLSLRDGWDQSLIHVHFKLK